jgi:hypothetical protein
MSLTSKESASISGVNRLMRRLNQNKLTPQQDVIAKIVALFTPVVNHPTALQAAKQVSAILTESGSPCTVPLALEALASYKGARNWDALVAKLPRSVSPAPTLVFQAPAQTPNLDTAQQVLTVITAHDTEAPMMHVPYVHDRFQIGDHVFVRSDTMHSGVRLPAKTEGVIKEVFGIFHPEGKKEDRRWLIAFSLKGEGVECLLYEDYFLTSQELQIQRMHGGEFGATYFAHAYGQALFEILGTQSHHFSPDKGGISVQQDNAPNERVVHFYQEKHEPTTFSNTVVFDMDGGYTIFPQVWLKLSPTSRTLVTPKDAGYNGFAPVKVPAGTSHHDAAQQVFAVMKAHTPWKYRESATGTVHATEEERNTLSQPKM